MFKNKELILLSLTLIVVIILGFFFYLKRNKRVKESFGSCDCNNNYWDNYFKIVDDGSKLQCDTSGCSPSDQTRLSDAWDSKKLNSMIPYFDSFNNILNEADFHRTDQGRYKNYLDDYKNKLTANYNMIKKINSSGWGASSSKYKTEYNDRWNGVSQCWTILNDLISSYDLIYKYFQADVSELKDLNYNTVFKSLRDRFYDYRYDASNHSDLNSNYGNQHYSRNDSFWQVIYYTYYCLVYLEDLIIYYQSVPDIGTLRGHLNGYIDYFSGKQIADYNVNNISSSVNHIYKYFTDLVNGYTGDKYLSTNVVGDSNISDSSTIAYKERANAYDNYLYETLGNCNNLYNNTVDKNNYQIGRFNYMNEAKEKIGMSMYINNVAGDLDAVNFTKGVFWDDTKGTWRPNQEESNYSYCNPISNGEIENNTNNVSIFNFKDYSDNLELQRKKIQYARKDLYSSMYGQDIQSQTISEVFPVCPSVDDQDNTSISSWERSDDTNQESTCLQKNSFAGEPQSYKIGSNSSFPTQMKAGYLVNGQDIWIENYQNIQKNIEQLRAVTGNSYNYNNRSSDHTDLIRQAGVLKGDILKDRDWNGSTYKWEKKTQKRIQNDLEYISKNYLSIYKNQNIDNSIIYNFNIHYQTSDNNYKYSTSTIFLNDNNNETVEKIKIKSSMGYLGFVRLYKNEYQYSDYLLEPSNLINLPLINTLKNFTFLSVIYNNLEWKLDEMIDYGYDLNIITSSIDNHHDLYSTNNSFLYYETGSQFGKLYSSPKNENNIESADFLWTIYRDPNTGYYMLYNKNNQVFLALGINYQLGNNFSVSTGISEANQNLDSNKRTRSKIFYFIKNTTLTSLRKSSDSSDQSLYHNMIQDSSWIIEEKRNNQYIIKSVSGEILWFTSNSFQSLSKTSTNIQVSKPLISNLTHISYSDVENSQQEESNYNFCDQHGNNNCFNKYFYIVPSPPENINSNFKTYFINSRTSSSIFEKCISQSGNNSLNTNKWFKKYDSENKYSYMDINKPEENKYSDLYSLYGEDGSYETGVLSLHGGDGDSCSTSNFCHVSKSLLSNEKSDGSVNSIEQDILPTNKQTESHQVSISYKNKSNKHINVNYNVPLRKYNFQCSRNEINIFKIYGNQTSITFDTNINPNLLTIDDDSYSSNDTNRKMIIYIYSLNNQYVEGRDFGMSSLGTFFWFRNSLDIPKKTYLDEKKLRVIYGNHNQILSKYLTINNSNIRSSLKRQRQKIITWDDKIKFMNIGYTFKKNNIYGYSNIPSSIVI